MRVLNEAWIRMKAELSAHMQQGYGLVYGGIAVGWVEGGSSDLLNPQSFNRYAYVQNDPINRVDPLGLFGVREGPFVDGGTVDVIGFIDDPFLDSFFFFFFGGFGGGHGLIQPERPFDSGGGGGDIISLPPLTPEPPPPPAPPPPAQRDCNFPSFDQLSGAQQGVLKDVGGSVFYNGLDDVQRASFLNITGALAAASVNLGEARLVNAEQDRLFFAAGTTGTFEASIRAGASANPRTFINDTPLGSEHPGMSRYGARQNVLRESVQVGFGNGGFADIDRYNPRYSFQGFLLHQKEVAENKLFNRQTDPFAVGKALGSGINGYNCK
ncbi:MAG: hypothetical protein ACRD4L_11560 [Pyrinomonadaceae bacterium]